MRTAAYIFILIVLNACSADLPDTQTLVDDIYNKKVEEYQRRKDRECRENALNAAEAHVD